MIEELSSERVRGEISHAEFASGARRVRAIPFCVRAIESADVIVGKVLLRDHAVVHLRLRNLPEADDIRDEHRDFLRDDTQREESADDETEQDVLEHVVLRAKHHGQG